MITRMLSSLFFLSLIQSAYSSESSGIASPVSTTSDISPILFSKDNECKGDEELLDAGFTLSGWDMADRLKASEVRHDILPAEVDVIFYHAGKNIMIRDAIRFSVIIGSIYNSSDSGRKYNNTRNNEILSIFVGENIMTQLIKRGLIKK